MKDLNEKLEQLVENKIIGIQVVDKKEKCNKNEDYMANHIMTYIKKGYTTADKNDRVALRAIKEVCEIIAISKKGLSYKDAEEIANEISNMINKDLHGDK